jgi:hypothetical protein
MNMPDMLRCAYISLHIFVVNNVLCKTEEHQNEVQPTGYNLKIDERVKENIVSTSGKMFSFCVTHLDSLK